MNKRVRAAWTLTVARVRRWGVLVAVYCPLPWEIDARIAVGLLRGYYAGSELEKTNAAMNDGEMHGYAVKYPLAFEAYLGHLLAMCCDGRARAIYKRPDLWRTITVMDGRDQKYPAKHEHRISRSSNAGSGEYSRLPDDSALERFEYRHGAAAGLPEISPAIIPSGMAYEWKRLAILGVSAPGRAGRGEAGWKFVPSRRHPTIPTDDKAKTKKRITYMGMALMEKPKVDVAAAHEVDWKVARQQVAPVEANKQPDPFQTTGGATASGLRRRPARNP